MAKRLGSQRNVERIQWNSIQVHEYINKRKFAVSITFHKSKLDLPKNLLLPES